MIKISVDKKDDGKKIITFLQNKFNNLSAGTIYKALRNKDIRINDVKVKENEILHENDIVTLYIKDELLYGQEDASLEIIYEDDNILVINKPQGIVVVSDKDEKGIDILVNEYCKLPYVKPCHRLDRNTSGLVVFAKNEEAEKAMLEMIKNRAIKAGTSANIVKPILIELLFII